MTRRAIDILALVSLVLAVAVLAAWVGSWSRPVAFQFGRTGERRELRLAEHAVTVTNEPQVRLESQAYEARLLAYKTQRGLVSPINDVSPIRRRSVDFVTLLFATTLLPAVWLASLFWRGRVARQRARMGQCQACGYNVRSTPYRCPECGKPVSKWAE